jgi:glycosyltransferase involved in cell wall biosynthesis
MSEILTPSTLSTEFSRSPAPLLRLASHSGSFHSNITSGRGVHKIVLIGPGYNSIPPTGWGAIESLIWDYYENLKKRGFDVIILNDVNLKNVIAYCNSNNPDVVHIMYDDYIIIAPQLKCNKILYTSHYSYITHPQFSIKYSQYFPYIFKNVIKFQKYITINAISEQIKQVYISNGFLGKINVVCNGAREDLFRFSSEPTMQDKSVYVAKIEKRKRQYKYQEISNIDFVGNFFDSSFNISNPNYIGEWDKPTLYSKLTEYANLILLSEGEADPLVVKEALIAGLGVVVSECASANLDKTLDFITVIPNDKLDDIQYINSEIIKNRRNSIQNRVKIREYASANFAWDKIIDKYVDTICKEPISSVTSSATLRPLPPQENVTNKAIPQKLQSTLFRNRFKMY